MKNSDLLNLLKLIREDRFISSNLDVLFHKNKKVDFNLFLNFDHEQVEEIINLEDSNLRFLYLYMYLNFNEKKFKLHGNVDVIVILSVILNKDIREREDYFGFVDAIIKANGNGPASCAESLLQDKDILKLSNALELFRNVARACGNGQANCARDYLYENKNSSYRNDSSVVSKIANSRDEKIAKFIKDNFRSIMLAGTNNAVKVMDMLSKAKNSVQAGYAFDFLRELNTFCGTRENDYEFNNRLIYAGWLANASGIVQAQEAYKLYFELKIQNRRLLVQLFEQIVHAKHEYQAKYGRIVAKNIIESGRYKVNDDVLPYVCAVANANGEFQAKDACVLVTERADFKYLLQLVKIIANASGDYQIACAYQLALNDTVLKLDNCLQIINSVANETDSSKIERIMNLVSDYEILPIQAPLRKYEQSASSEVQVSVGEILAIEELDVIIDALSVIEEEDVTKDTSVGLKRLVRDIKQRRGLVNKEEE